MRFDRRSLFEVAAALEMPAMSLRRTASYPILAIPALLPLIFLSSVSIASPPILRLRSGTTLVSGVGDSQINSGAPPVVICGQTLYQGAVGVVTEKFVRPGRYELPGGLQAGMHLPKVLDFAASCHTGVTVVFKPRGNLSIYSEARTDDRKIAAIALVAHHPGVVRVIALRSGGHRTIVVVRVRQGLGAMAACCRKKLSLK